MVGRAALLYRLPLVTSVLIFYAFAVPRADAQQQPRLAISETTAEFLGRDATREYFEVANIGDTVWNPSNFWAARLAGYAATPQLFVRIQGVDPVQPGGVLWIEWGRPLDEGNDDEKTDCTTRGNVFCTTRTDSAGNDFDSSDLQPIGTGLAIFAPTTSNQPPTVANGTMLAYFIAGDLTDIDKEVVGYNQAVKVGMWKEGDTALPAVTQYARELRMGPPGTVYPPTHGRSSADYFTTLYGIASLNDEGLMLVSPPAAAPNQMNRAGTIAKPNYVQPGLPIPGQIAAGVLSVRAQAVAASLAAGAPAALQVVGQSAVGGIATSLYANGKWSDMALALFAPVVDGIILVNNPVKGSRTLIARLKADGALFAFTSSGSAATFGVPAELGMKAKFAPAAVVGADGKEHYLAVDSSGAIQYNVNDGGKLGTWQVIPGATTDAPVAAAFATDPAGLSVLAFNGNQLTLYRLGADGKFGPGTNVGSAVSARPAGIGPVLAWNEVAKRLEIVALVGALSDEKGAEVQHARAELTPAEAKVGALAAITGIQTNAAPAIAIHGDSGQIRLLARGGGRDPGANASTETAGGVDMDPGAPQAGFVFETLFAGGAWGAPKRVGLGRLPGVSVVSPAFTVPAAPVTLFDPNTKRIQDFLIGEDAQIYPSTP